MDPLIHLKFSKLVATSGMLHINVKMYVMSALAEVCIL